MVTKWQTKGIYKEELDVKIQGNVAGAVRAGTFCSEVDAGSISHLPCDDCSGYGSGMDYIECWVGGMTTVNATIVKEIVMCVVMLRKARAWTKTYTRHPNTALTRLSFGARLYLTYYRSMCSVLHSKI